MTVVIPKFRAAGADYVFLVDEAGRIVRVFYPSGDAFLRATEHD